MLRLFRFLGCLFLVATLVAIESRCAQADLVRKPIEKVVISLQESCEAQHELVLISDIARIETADSALKSRIANLDVIEVPARGQTATISAKLVEFRLRLAGIDARAVSIRGSQTQVTSSESPVRFRGEQDVIGQDERPAVRATGFSPTVERTVEKPPKLDSKPVANRMPEVTHADVNFQDKSPEETILAVATKAVLDQLPWNAEDVSCTLVQPIGRDAKLIDPNVKNRCIAKLRTAGAPVGRVTVEVSVKSGDQTPIDIPVSLDVRHFDTVVSTARPIPRGRKIQRDDLYVRRWDVTGSTDYCTELDQIVGRVAGRMLPATQIIREQDLERVGEAQSGDRPVMVKRASRVKMLAKIGDLSITVAGEAMQDGRLGDTIRVQNVESKQIVQGRVISAEEVEIAY